MSRGASAGRSRGRYQRTALRKYGRKLRRVGGYKGGALGARVSRIERTIETKEGLGVFVGTNVALPHNAIVKLRGDCLYTVNGAADPMAGAGNRVGDRITLKGIKIRMMLQNQAERPKVFYRIMFIKSAKGDTPTRATLFKGISGNKMIDQINTERFTIISQRILNLSNSNSMAWTSATLGGVPQASNGGTVGGSVGTKIIDMWIPGKRVARNGIIQYENEGNQPKFFDYHLYAMAYDWFGTPQDINNVGAVSEGWIKLYYQDA